MAYRIYAPLGIIPFTAENAITQYAVVEHGTSAGQVDLPDAGGDQVAGVAIEAQATAGNVVQVATGGIVICIANGTITRGQFTNAVVTTGRVAGFTSGVTTATRLVGPSYTDADAADQCSVLLIPGHAATT